MNGGKDLSHKQIYIFFNDYEGIKSNDDHYLQTILERVPV